MKTPSIIACHDCACGSPKSIIKSVTDVVKRKHGGPVKVVQEGNKYTFYVNDVLRGRLTLANMEDMRP